MSSLNLSRQADLIKNQDLYRILIIGGGAIGSNVAYTLGMSGYNCHIVDPDVIEEPNLAPGMFSADCIGKPKHEGIASLLRAAGSDVKITGAQKEFDPNDLNRRNVVIVGVDSLETRREIFSAIEQVNMQLLFIDGRIGGHATTVYAMSDAYKYNDYRKTLEVEAVDLPCGRKATAYITRIAAGFIVNAIVRHQNRNSVPFVQVFEADASLMFLA